MPAARNALQPLLNDNHTLWRVPECVFLANDLVDVHHFDVYMQQSSVGLSPAVLVLQLDVAIYSCSCCSSCCTGRCEHAWQTQVVQLTANTLQVQLLAGVPPVCLPACYSL